eukprot:1158426-Pelagomonas_calceolata.AAC.4
MGEGLLWAGHGGEPVGRKQEVEDVPACGCGTSRTIGAHDFDKTLWTLRAVYSFLHACSGLAPAGGSGALLLGSV